MSDPTLPDDPAEGELVARLTEARGRLLAEVGKVVVGHAEALEHLLIALLCRGHCLLEGVPGLAKTTMVQALAQALDLSASRIQFTPDLMPADITGTDLIQEDPQSGRRQYEFLPGPLFANLVLADEVNRTPPKTQAALLEAMQERRVTSRGRAYELPEPFLVLATQNPIEQEGTYPLPEAQLDRFMFKVLLGYPSRDDEVEVLRRTTGAARVRPERVFSARELVRLQDLVRGVPAPPEVLGCAADLVRATRPGGGDGPSRWLQWGAGPRAGQMLVLGAKARALLHGRFHATREDLRALAAPVLRHRLVPTFAAQAQGVEVEAVVAEVLAAREGA